MSELKIVDTSICRCDKGVAPGVLSVTSQQFVKTNGLLHATEGDKTITPFGVCAVTRSPCSMLLTKWMNTAQHTKVNGMKYLTEKSKIMCGVGGMISFVQSNQTFVKCVSSGGGNSGVFSSSIGTLATSSGLATGNQTQQSITTLQEESTMNETVQDLQDTEITAIQWHDAASNQVIDEIQYNDTVHLTAQVINPQGSTVEVSITKEDGSKFSTFKTELKSTATIDKNGYIKITDLEIKEQWEAYNTNTIGRLVATISHGRLIAKSNLLTIIPKLKYVATLDRLFTYSGEFGFDWMRMHYENISESYESLKKEYTPITIHDQEYFVPWISMFPKQQGVSLLLSVETIIGEARVTDKVKFQKINGIRFEPNEIRVNTINEGNGGQEIKIFCDTPQYKNMTIDLLDQDDQIVGRLNFFKNANHKQLHFEITPVRILRKGHNFNTETDISIINGTIDSGFGKENEDIEGDLKNLEMYLNTQSLNQALLQCRIGKVYDIIINEQEWIQNKFIFEDSCVFIGNMLPKFNQAFKKQHPEAYKSRGITMYLSPINDGSIDTVDGHGAYANLRDIDAKGMVVFRSNLYQKETFAHEIAHIAGLEHSFIDEFQYKPKDLHNDNEYILDVESHLQYMLENEYSQEEISRYWKSQKHDYQEARNLLNVHYRNLHKFKQSNTENFMDYYNQRKTFWKFQWKALQDDIIKFYKSPK